MTYRSSSYSWSVPLRKRPEVSREKVETVFSDHYRIPPFQREFSWQRENVSDLIEDLDGLVTRSESYYFLGQIVTTTQDSDENLEQPYVVDGQQRLVTIQLLACYLYKRMSDSRFSETAPLLLQMVKTIENRGGFRLKVFLKKGDHIFRKILADEPLPEVGEVESATERNLIEAFSQIKDSLDGRDDEYIAEFQLGLRTRTFFSKLEIGTIGEALEVFEVMNQRGLKLSDSDLIKNFLFRNLDEEEFESFSQTWDSVAKKIFKLRPRRLASFNSLLRSELIARTGSVVSTETLLQGWDEYLIGSGASSTPREFIRELPTFADAYCKFSDLRRVNDTPFPDGAALKYFRTTQHFPILMAGRRLRNLDFLVRLVEERILLSLFAAEGPQNFERLVPIWAKSINELAIQNARATTQEILGESSRAFSDLPMLWERFSVGFGRLTYIRDKKRIRYVLARISGALESKCFGESDDDFLNGRRIHIEHIEPASSSTWSRQELSDNSQLHSIGNLTLIRRRPNSSMGDAPPADKVEYYRGSWAINQMLCPSENLEIPESNRKNAILQLQEDFQASLQRWEPDVVERRGRWLMNQFAETLNLMNPPDFD